MVGVFILMRVGCWVEPVVQWWRWWDGGCGAVLGAQVCDEVGDFVVGEGVGEGGHFFAAHDELRFDFFVGPGLAEVGR